MNATLTAEPGAIAPPVDIASLSRFMKSGHPTFGGLFTIHLNRGDCTQTTENRLKLAMGEAAYAHLHWDTGVCNGRVLILLRRYRHPGAAEARGIGFPAEWYWCFDQIEDKEEIEAAAPAQIARVPSEVRESLSVLPELEWIRVRRVHYFQHSRGRATKKHRPAPDGVLFFRFTGGIGLAIAERESEVAA